MAAHRISEYTLHWEMYAEALTGTLTSIIAPNLERNLRYLTNKRLYPQCRDPARKSPEVLQLKETSFD